MAEIFKNIPNYKGYQVSNLGNVKSLSRWRNNRFGGYLMKEKILVPCINKGYYRVCLSSNKKGHVKHIHQLVAMTFLDHKPNGHKLVINHLNNIHTDNRLSNLEITTQRANCYTHHNGTSKYTGVSWREGRKTWIAQIYINGKRKYIGSSKNEEIASKMYQSELNKLNNAA